MKLLQSSISYSIILMHLDTIIVANKRNLVSPECLVAKLIANYGDRPRPTIGPVICNLLLWRLAFSFLSLFIHQLSV